MRVISAYLLAVLGGKENPTSDDIKGILDSVSVEVEQDRIDSLLSELEGKNIEEVIASGVSKLASVPSGGGGGGGGGAAAAAGGGGGGAAEAAKEEEKKEEPEEESDEDMGFSLFD